MDKRRVVCGTVLREGSAAQSGLRPDFETAAVKRGTGRGRKFLPLLAAALLIFALLTLPGCGQGSSEGGAASASRSEEPQEDSLSRESVEQVLELINQSEKLLDDSYQKLGALQEEEYTEGKFNQYASLLDQTHSDLSALRGQADEISLSDKTLRDAVDEYFSMVSDSQRSLFEIWDFMADYFELLDSVLCDKPLPENYTDVGEYFDDLYEWYQKAEEGYDAIESCPSCMDSQWKRYGDNLDMNYGICQKLYDAQRYHDPLRQQSAINMAARNDTVDELQYTEFLDALKGELDHSSNQRRIAASLAEEIHSYVELEEEDRSEYTFQYIRKGKITLAYDALDTIYPALYNTYDAFLVIRTGCISGTRDILVEAEIPGFTQSYQETFHLDSAYKAIYIKPPALTGDLDLASSKNAQIKVSVFERDGTVIEVKTFPVTLKSKYDFEWRSDEYGVATKDNILCFLTPESPSISNLKRQAIDEIGKMSGGQMESFVGYQNTVWNNHFVGTYLQTAGIMRALYESGVRYSMDPFSISGSNQHILFPDDVLRQRSGLCIETSLVVASALQSAGMHVFLIFPPGHAQVAVEIWNGTGQSTSGTGQYFLIETTALSSSRNNQDIFVEEANSLLENRALNKSPIQYLNSDSWKEYISGDTYIVDCDDYEVLGLTPFSN